MYMINKEINTEKLFAENKRYVELVAKQYQNKGLTMEQLIKEGNEGLLAAAKFFDESRGIFFPYYASWWIRQSILEALVEHEAGEPRVMKEHERTIRKGIDEGRSISDIARELNLTELRVKRLYKNSYFKKQDNV